MRRYSMLVYNGAPKMQEAPNGDFVKYEDAKPNEQLRDEFAMAALTGMLAKPVRRTFVNAAADAYRYADAMLGARNANR